MILCLGFLSLDVLESCGYALSNNATNTTVLVQDCDVTVAVSSFEEVVVLRKFVVTALDEFGTCCPFPAPMSFCRMVNVL